MATTTIQLSDSIADRFGKEAVSFDARFNDADSGVGFMISQLAYLEAQMYETPYADIIFDRVVPVRTDVPDWATNVNYLSFNSATQGAFVASHAKDLPSVAMNKSIHNVMLGYGGLSLNYSLDDMRKAAHLGINLDAEQAQQAYRGAREHQQRVVLYGDSSLGLGGFLNNSNIAVDSTSALNTQTATANDLVDCINAAIRDVWSDTKQRFLPNTLCLDTVTYARLASIRLTDVVGIYSGLEYLQKRSIYSVRTGQDLEVIPMPQLVGSELKSAGINTTGNPMAVVYEKTPQNVLTFMPIAPRFIAPQAVGLEIITPMEYKISGTEFRYPQSAKYIQFAG